MKIVIKQSQIHWWCNLTRARARESISMAAQNMARSYFVLIVPCRKHETLATFIPRKQQKEL